MALRTTSQAGNWSDSSTWGAAPPGNGDTAQIDHDVTVDANVTVGTSPSDTTTMAITMAAGKTLTLAAGVTLIVRGNLQVTGNGGGITFSAGSTWKWDASQAGTPATTYVGTISSGFSGAATLTFNGTQANPVIITSDSGGGFGRFEVGNSDFNMTGSWVRVSNIGDSTHFAFKPYGTINLDHYLSNNAGGLGFYFRMTNFTFTNCTWKNTLGPVYGGTGNIQSLQLASTTSAGTRVVSGCRFDAEILKTGRGTTYSNNVYYGGWAEGEGDETVTTETGSVIRKPTNISFSAVGPMTNCVMLTDNAPVSVDSGTATSATSTTFTDSGKSWTANQFIVSGLTAYFVQITGGTGAGQIRGIFSHTSTALTLSRAWDTVPDNTSTYTIHLGVGNPHGITKNSFDFNGCVFQQLGSDGNGDVLLGYGGDLKTCLVLPSVAKTNSGTLLTTGVGTGTVVDHNTAYTGDQSALVFDDTGISEAGCYASIRSNLVWSDNLDYTSYLCQDNSGGPSGVTDPVDPADAEYNGRFGVSGYYMNTSGSPGANDITGQDPEFVDPWRHPGDWAATLGATGTTLQKIAKSWAYLMAANDPDDADYNASATPAALLAYLRAGSAPTNPIYQNAGHDGVTTGAVAGVFPGLPRRLRLRTATGSKLFIGV